MFSGLTRQMVADLAAGGETSRLAWATENRRKGIFGNACKEGEILIICQATQRLLLGAA